ncbi:MarR family transcriptional regulator [Paenimyroides tangerinum]|uniref:MarR family transcriptional regulator n=1 Tax=Paenimyroides tangerinum TaxID=2488728 RepID=A0A3P3VXZ7_9FLAO|nr:helix-turn-helix domain-containing protein [Paenimyroides tangerinum]RRJ86349.1 MarR family transcriptional regulator [Paenimyroides tangerinum]
MEKLKEYIYHLLGQKIELKKLSDNILNKLPFLFRNSYEFYSTRISNHELIFLVLDKEDTFNPQQLRKQLEIIRNVFNKPVVVIAEDITTVNRKRLIDYKISFISPGKQMFLTELLVDFQDFNKKEDFRKNIKLLPSAQLIVLYHILHREDDLSKYTFKELADKFQYTQMGITKAVNDLKRMGLIDVIGTKEKSIVFENDVPKLWKQAEDLFVDPILKAVYIDKKPEKLLRSNTTALEEYTDMNPGLQDCFAIERNRFYQLKKEKQFTNLNEENGTYALEVWKYNPEIIAKGITKKNNVDPLSLYLSLKDGFIDERTDMALDQIIKKYIW